MNGIITDIKKISLLIILLCNFNITSGQIRLDSGLVACYPFNGNSNDESGNGNDGTNYGATLCADRFGNLNSSYSFNGKNNYIKIPNSASYLTIDGEITVSSWVKTNSSGEMGIISKEENGYISNTLQSWDQFIYNETSGGGLNAYNGADNAVYGKIKIDDDKWHNILLTASNQKREIALYVDGKLDSKFNVSGTIIAKTTSFVTIGVVDPINNHAWFFGIIDDIRVYNRVVNQNEIDSLYNEKYTCGCIPFSINLGKDTTLCSSCSIKLHTGKGYENYKWQDGTSDSIFVADKAGKYWVTVKNSMGCEGSDTIYILMKDTSQFVTCDFEIPDTVCLNQNFEIINKSQGATNYYWNFCNSNYTKEKYENLGNIGALNKPVYIALANDGANYFAFVVNHDDGSILRYDYGNSMLNKASIVNLGILLPLYMEELQIRNENGKWYGIIVGEHSGSIRRLEFGNSLTNIPTVVNMGNIGNLSFPTSFKLYNINGEWLGLTSNIFTSTITLFNFGNSLTNTPTGQNLGNIGNLNTPLGMNTIYDNGNWYMFVGNQVDHNIIRLDFGSTINNNKPKASIIGTIPNSQYPNNILITRDCDTTKVFIITTDQTLKSGKLIKGYLDGGISGTLKIKTNTNPCNLAYPHSFSDIYRVGDTLYSMILNVSNNTIARISLPNMCSNSNFPSSEKENPNPISYDKAGVYNISLTIDEGLPSQNIVCKTIVIRDTVQKLNLSTNSPICEGETLEITSNTITGAIYKWSGPNGFISADQNLIIPNATQNIGGDYYLSVTIPNGCKDNSAKIKVTIFPKKKINLGNDTTICPGSNLILNSKLDSVSYKWNNNSNNKTLFVNKAGKYSITIIDKNGCTNSDSITISEYPPSNIDLGRDTTLCDGCSIILNASNDYNEYLWPDGSTVSNYIVNSQGKYWVIVTDKWGCKYSDTINVIEECNGKDLIIPNCFTPNGDELNETFKPISKCIKDFKMLIFNRWGNKLFETDDINKGWDGKYLNKDVAEGVYLYVISYSINENNILKKKIKNGIVTVLK